MRNLTATLCLTIAVLLGSAGNAFSEGEWFPTDKPNCDIWNPRSQPNETARWSGDCLNGKAHGYGRTTWRFLKNKKMVERTIDGEVQNGKRLGLVRIIYENGDVYVGMLHATNGKRHGHGTYTYTSGLTKEGIWVDGKFMEAFTEV